MEPRPATGRAGAGRLVVVRHGETAWSRAGRHTGRSDVSLTAAGRRQARALSPRLAGDGFARVLTSPLVRARETAELAGFAAADVDDDLVEWDYGAYEGRTSEAIRAARPGWDLWRDGVPDGERLTQVAVRARRLVTAVRRVDGDVLVFAHAHILRAVTACWLGLPASAGAVFSLRPAAVGVLGWERQQPSLLRWDDGGDPLA